MDGNAFMSFFVLFSVGYGIAKLHQHFSDEEDREDRESRKSKRRTVKVRRRY